MRQRMTPAPHPLWSLPGRRPLGGRPPATRARTNEPPTWPFDPAAPTSPLPLATPPRLLHKRRSALSRPGCYPVIKTLLRRAPAANSVPGCRRGVLPLCCPGPIHAQLPEAAPAAGGGRPPREQEEGRVGLSGRRRPARPAPPPGDGGRGERRGGAGAARAAFALRARSHRPLPRRERHQLLHAQPAVPLACFPAPERRAGPRPGPDQARPGAARAPRRPRSAH
jgi:hypothetical protein